MVDSLLGVELPLPVKLVVAFVVVLALIALATWALRRIGGTRLGTPPARGRQPRLAVIDAAPVDGRRRLVLIRRDNVEHLIMIGGPTDVVVEQNILRAVPVAPREPPPRMAPEAPPARAATEGMRPVASPEIAPRAAPARPPRGCEPPPQAQTRERRESAPRPPRPPDPPPPASPADANLSDMAQRLEAALRRPSAAREPAPARDASRGAKEPQPAAAERAALPAQSDAPAAPHANPGAPAATVSQAPEAKPARTEPKPAPQKSVIDSLEEEMASLLGRPPNKE